jgi:hypothetical protein
MRRIQGSVFALSLLFSAACGFGFADDTGKPIPAADYWGWQCADGSTPDRDAGCPLCPDGTVPDADAGCPDTNDGGS